MAELIAIGTTELASSDFTLTTDSATLFLKDAAGSQVDSNALAEVQIKSSGGEYFTIGALTWQIPGKVLSGAGTYRVVRRISAVAFGVDKN